MHILFVSDNFPPETNAPATRLHEHAKRWVRAGHRVTVVTCAPNFPRGEVFSGYSNRWLQRETLDGIEVLRVKTFITKNSGFFLRTLDFLSFMVMGFFGGLLPRKPDVVVASSPQFFAALGGWWLAVVRRKPFVFEVRDLWPASIIAVGAMRKSLLVRALEQLELFLYRRAQAIVTVTHAFKRDLIERGIDEHKIAVVTNGVDLERYAPQPKDERVAEEFGVRGKHVIGYLGTHGMAHALDNVLAAAEHLRDESGVHFLFIGNGAAKASLVESCAARGLTNVSFHEPQPKERMPELWALCDTVLVHLKRDKVFETVIPSKIFEAMGMGRPILLASPEGEAAGIVRATNCGIWIPAEDAVALADAARRMCASSDDNAVFARASHAAASQYSRDALATDMLEILAATIHPARFANSDGSVGDSLGAPSRSRAA